MIEKKFKEKLLHELYEPYTHCTQCPLGLLGRENVVFGQGNANAHLVLVGEGPGVQEDAQGEPFVGRSGKLLTRCLKNLGIDRSDIYITNIVKCRPPNNRTPTTLEATTCKNLLLVKQVQIIKPLIICTLGAAAYKSLTENATPISHARGKLFTWELIPQIKIIPTYHPAYILRNQSALHYLMQDLQKAIKLSHT